MKNYIMLCKKHIKSSDNEFDTFFAYRQSEKDGKYEDILSPMTDNEGKSIMIAKPIKVALSKDAYSKLEKETFPLGLILNDEMKTEDNRDTFYVTIDKDKEKAIRLDKNGKKHYILVIREFEGIYRTSAATLSNFDQLD